MLRHAAEHLLRALEQVPGFTEARLLLVLVDGGTMVSDPTAVTTLAPRLTDNAKTVFAEAPDNPRVKFLRAFMSYLPARRHARGEGCGAGVLASGGRDVSPEVRRQ